MKFKGGKNMAIEVVTTENFKEKIASGITLVDFYADWCGPCKMIAPVLEEVAKEVTDVNIVKVNVDDSPEVSQQYGVMSIPTLILIKDGEEIAQTMGYQPKETLIKWINDNRK